jgi:methyltransferase (TIGR00027 family)
MSKAAARTAIGPTALIAVEQLYPEKQRIIHDELAFHMLPATAKSFVRILKFDWMRNWIIALSEKSEPGIWGGLLCRKRYIDEKLTASRNDIEMVLNLGAGFDTRCFRLSTLSNVPAWEVDQPENIEAKKTRLREALRSIPSNVKFVPIDFDYEEISTVLESRG